MSQGWFGERGELFFEVELVTADELYLPVEVMLDTGFTGYLAINEQDIESLGWTFIRKDEMQTAQGMSLFDLYRGQVRFNGQKFEIPVFTGDDLPEILWGCEWLKIFDLIAKYREGLLVLE